MDPLRLLLPDWPAPARVKAVSTLRSGGVSRGPYTDFMHVGDDPQAVRANRAHLKSSLRLPSEPVWLNQVHGSTVIEAQSSAEPPTADASIARGVGPVCAVMTADCLPVLFCSKSGDRVAAAHAGWRGLAAGVLDSTVASLGLPGSELLAWLGPAISQPAFEVGDEVRIAFTARDAAAQRAFKTNDRGRWQADLYELARLELARLGVHDVYGGGRCTVGEADQFFSFRRDGTTGRMATLIWLTS
jgi:YfiH family protein